MKKTALLIAVLSMFIDSPVMAEKQVEVTSTYELYGSCIDVIYEDETLTTSAYCKGFIQGAVNAHKYFTTYHNVPEKYCLPQAITEKELIKIFIKYVDEHRQVIEKPATSTLYYILDQEFPCPQSKSSKILYLYR
ncbi:MAG: hypothetical protein JRF02_10050 [Deltaproteobacteria bacterium]|jgi:hypothetical protein|nr:hypothetical protein [Deltaproteobacteria bacterium]